MNVRQLPLESSDPAGWFIRLSQPHRRRHFIMQDWECGNPVECHCISTIKSARQQRASRRTPSSSENPLLLIKHLNSSRAAVNLRNTVKHDGRCWWKLNQWTVSKLNKYTYEDNTFKYCQILRNKIKHELPYQWTLHLHLWKMLTNAK